MWTSCYNSSNAPDAADCLRAVQPFQRQLIRHSRNARAPFRYLDAAQSGAVLCHGCCCALQGDEEPLMVKVHLDSKPQVTVGESGTCRS